LALDSTTAAASRRCNSAGMHANSRSVERLQTSGHFSRPVSAKMLLHAWTYFIGTPAASNRRLAQAGCQGRQHIGMPATRVYRSGTTSNKALSPTLPDTAAHGCWHHAPHFLCASSSHKQPLDRCVT
jgi:hypothetical protein